MHLRLDDGDGAIEELPGRYLLQRITPSPAALQNRGNPAAERLGRIFCVLS
jgi:hypothetical protein